jgi:hypothetical protein
MVDTQGETFLGYAIEGIAKLYWFSLMVSWLKSEHCGIIMNSTFGSMVKRSMH